MTISVRRRALAAALGAGVVIAAADALARPQAGRTYRVGLLGAESERVARRDLERLRGELRALGYADGPALTYELRWADSDYAKLTALARELATSRVDVIVASGSKAGIAAKEATASVPVVVSNMGDALLAGFTGSLARPGGNVTGFSAMNPEVTAKQLALLREVRPGAKRIGVLMNPANPNYALTIDALKRAGGAAGVRVDAFDAARAEAIPAAIRTAAEAGCEAMVVQSETLYAAHAETIAALAIRHRIATAGLTSYAREGMLFGYSAPIGERWRQVAGYVDRILNGVPPGALPIAQPAKVEFVVNLRTARALGVTVPEALLARADEVLR